MDVPGLLRETRLNAGLTQAEIANRAGTSQAAVARYERGTVAPSTSTLERLVRAGGAELVVSTVPASPTNLSSRRARAVRARRAELIGLAAQAGASNLRLFGSVARGEDGPDSDIDIMVDFDPSAGLMPLFRLADQIESLLGEPVDVVAAGLMTDDVARSARRDSVPL